MAEPWNDRRQPDRAGETAPEPGYATAGSTWQAAQAEVLPPVVLPPPSAQRPRRRRGWASAPATYVLVGINCAVYLAMTLTGASPSMPTSRQLLSWGATWGPAVLLGHQWWRLVSAMFVHIGFLHLATNMWCLWNLGLLGEPLLGVEGLIGAYLLTGYAGNLLSIALHPGITEGSDQVIGAGASGAIFGIAGVLIILLSSKYLPLAPADRKSLRRSVIWFAVLNFVFAAGINLGHFSIDHAPLLIDNSAHFGGFLEGLILALPLVPKVGAPSSLFRSRRNLAFAGHVLLMVLLSVFLSNLKGL